MQLKIIIIIIIQDYERFKRAYTENYIHATKKARKLKTQSIN